MGKLKGKVAVVTGAGSGMGRASALLFAAEGAQVVCADVSGHQESAAAEIGTGRDRGARRRLAGSGREGDVRGRGGDVRPAGRGVQQRRASTPHHPLDETDDDLFDRLVAVNLRGVFLGIKYAIPALRASGGGSIISTASATGLVGRKGIAAYGGTKGGVVALTMGAALDFAADNIRVNCICPGMIYTGRGGAPADNAGPGAGPADARPDGPLRTPREIATAAVFLASDDSSYITGVALPVDGGYVAE